jgi:hypothetical protein
LERIPDEGVERKRQIEEWKKHYAQMLIEIRPDAFDKIDLSVDEVAQRLPWVWGDEPTANGRATAPERSVEAHDEDLENPGRGGTAVEPCMIDRLGAPPVLGQRDFHCDRSLTPIPRMTGLVLEKG